MEEVILFADNVRSYRASIGVGAECADKGILFADNVRSCRRVYWCRSALQGRSRTSLYSTALGRPVHRAINYISLALSAKLNPLSCNVFPPPLKSWKAWP